jgi:hypothetical protein
MKKTENESDSMEGSSKKKIGRNLWNVVVMLQKILPHKYATIFLFHTTHVLVNNMVIVSSNRILMNKQNQVDNVNSISETSTVCTLCKSDNTIITDPKSGEIICSKCGMVILEKSLERKTNWQQDLTEGEARTGLARHDMGLSTIIGKENMDSRRNKINPSILDTLNRLRTWDFRTQLNNSKSSVISNVVIPSSKCFVQIF